MMIDIKMKNLRNVLHNAGFYLDFINECMKLVELVRDGECEFAKERADYIYNKFMKGEEQC